MHVRKWIRTYVHILQSFSLTFSWLHIPCVCYCAVVKFSGSSPALSIWYEIAYVQLCRNCLTSPTQHSQSTLHSCSSQWPFRSLMKLSQNWVGGMVISSRSTLIASHTNSTLRDSRLHFAIRRNSHSVCRKRSQQRWWVNPPKFIHFECKNNWSSTKFINFS